MNKRNRHGPDSILFVSYHYPPDSRIGAKRIARLVRFLTGHGWTVDVLTVDPRYYDDLDQSIETHENGITRTRMLGSAGVLFRRMKQTLWKALGRFSRKGTPVADGAKHPAPAAPSQNGRSSFVSHVKNFVFSIMWCPDDRQGWIPFGVAALLKLSRGRRLCYSSGPPHSTHLIPLLARLIRRDMVWVAEFRDPWYSNPQPFYFANRLTRWLDKVMERAVVRNCSCLISVTEDMSEDFRHRYPSLIQKMKTYSNGFDEAELAEHECPRTISRDKLQFFHAGSFVYGRTPYPFLKAISELIREGKIGADDVRVVFFGDGLVNGVDASRINRDLGVDSVVRWEINQPHRVCLQEMRRSDVLLLFNIDQPIQVPAKVYEYLLARRNILNISTGGITDRIINRTQTGASFSPDDINGIKVAILGLLKNRAFRGDESEIQKFNLNFIFSDLMQEMRRLSAT